ncbi:MAG: LysM peptidoglycan-binding domain-containing protein [Syntrophomonadaceae bacterium]|nr:LysM peptidoglycan-binding domain-containing protein [Syntrophomonadaceae bacterium]
MKQIQGPVPYFSSRVLRLQVPYQQGLDIKILQALLNLLPEPMGGQQIEVDGIFGPDTRKALMLFQKYFQLAVTGASSDETYHCLGHSSGKFSRGNPVFSSRMIIPGSQGRDVQILQNRLSAYYKTYLNRPGSGKYDKYTARAVKSLQEDFKLTGEEDRVGPYTYALILLQSPLGGRILQKGRHGLDTYFLQLYLKRWGYYHATSNGFFSHSTFKALTSFQRDAAIRADGIVGPQTYLALGHAQSFPPLEYSCIIENADTISKLSRLVKQPEAKLMKFNKFKGRGKRLKPGQCLRPPTPLAFHLIEKNDSLKSIADKYGLDPQHLTQANPIQAGQGLVPGATLFLPEYKPRLKGQIWYLNNRPGSVELKSINLKNMHRTILYRFNEEELGFGRHGLEKGIGASHIWPKVYRLWRNNAAYPPATLGHKPWCLKKKDNFYSAFNKANSSPKAISPSLSADRFSLWNKFSPVPEPKAVSSPGYAPPIIETSINRYFDEQALVHYRLSLDNNHLLLFVIIPPARETAAFLYHLPSEELRKISEHAIDGVFSSDSQLFLLLEKDSYGAYYPWFYQQIKLYSSRGYCRGEVIKVRSCQFNQYCFNPDNTLLLFIMHTPRTFYPLPEYCRHMYIKPLQSPLLFQLTSNERPFYPIWI